MSTFEAKYHGTCGACAGHISPGDEVTYDGTDTLIHAQCPEAVIERRGEVCGRCFMEMPLVGGCPSCD